MTETTELSGRYLIADRLCLDLEDREASLDGKPLGLTAKPHAILALLMERAGRVVSKDELFTRAWGGFVVSDAALTTAIREVRRALGDDARAPEWIETKHGLGYRFRKDVTHSGNVPPNCVKVSASLPPNDAAGPVGGNGHGLLNEDSSPTGRRRSGVGQFWRELKRRNVVRVTAAYAVVAWLLVQVSVAVLPVFGAPSWVLKAFFVFLAAALPLVILLAWAFELTPDGVRRTGPALAEPAGPNRTQDAAILAGLVLVAFLSGILLLQGNQSPDLPALPRGPADPVISVAVLPFQDFSPETDQAYFSDGVAEQILRVLAQVDGLRVASRMSAFAIAERGADISDIGRTLGVGHVLEGSVSLSGDTLRVTVQLIDVATDQHIWAETYDRPMTADGIFAIQDEVAEAVMMALTGRSLPSELVEPGERTSSLAALDAVLQGRMLAEQRTPASLVAARDAFERAIEADPAFAPAYAGLAEVHFLSVDYGGADREEAYMLARGRIDQALALDPASVDARLTAAGLAMREMNFDEGLQYANEAFARDPNDARVLQRRGGLFIGMGRYEDAIEMFRQARLVDPLSPATLANLALAQSASGQHGEALATARDNARWNSKTPASHMMVGLMALNAGDPVASFEGFSAALAIAPGYAHALNGLFETYVDIGLLDLAAEVASDRGQRALVLALRGELLPPDPGRTLPDARAAFLTGDLETARMAFAALIEQWDVLGANPLPGWASAHAASMVVAFEAANDPLADQIRERLTSHVDGLGEEGWEPSDYMAAASLAALEGQDDAAVEYLATYAAAGYGGRLNVEYNPLYDGLHGRADFDKVIARLEAADSAYRAAIRKALSSPKANHLETTD